MLKKAREKKDLTQKDLAIRTGLNQSYISKLESTPNYKHSPTLRQVAKISKELDICPLCLANWFLSFHMKCANNCIDAKTIISCKKLMLIHNS